MNIEQAKVQCKSHLDLDSLTKRCLGRIALVEKILAAFCTNASTDLSDIEQAIEKSDLERVTKLSHRLKGTSLTVSAERMAEYSKQLEATAHLMNHDQLRDSLSELREELRVIAELVHGTIRPS